MARPSDVFEREVGLPVGCDAGVDQARDVRVRQPGEDAAFALEACAAGEADEGQVEQLDGDAAAVAAVAAAGAPDAAHAALAEHRLERIRAQDLAGQRVVVGCCEVVGTDAFGEKVRAVAGGMIGEQRPHLIGELGLGLRQGLQPSVALDCGQSERFVEQRAQPLPAGGIQRAARAIGAKLSSGRCDAGNQCRID